MEQRKISVNIPSELFEVMAFCSCKNKSKGGRAENITDFITTAIIERCYEILDEDEGSLSFSVSNPADTVKITADQEAFVMKIRTTFNELDFFRHLGKDCGFDRLSKYLVTRFIGDGDNDRKGFIEKKAENLEVKKTLNMISLERCKETSKI